MAFTYPPSSGGGEVALNDLTDATITTPQRGQVLRYNGTEWVDSDVNKIIVPATQPTNLWYTPKGVKTDAFNYFDPNNCTAFDIMFDAAMWFTDYGIIVKNFPSEGWAGGGCRVWVFNSDPATGLPSTLNRELGILDIPAAGTAPMPFMATHVTDTIPTSGLYLEANTRYWIATSMGTGPVEGTYGNGPGPDVYQVKGLSDSVASNYPSSDGNFFFGADNSSMFIGSLQTAGGINLTTPPANAGTIFEQLNSTNGAICVVLKGGRD